MPWNHALSCSQILTVQISAMIIWLYKSNNYLWLPKLQFSLFTFLKNRNCSTAFVEREKMFLKEWFCARLCTVQSWKTVPILKNVNLRSHKFVTATKSATHKKKCLEVFRFQWNSTFIKKFKQLKMAEKAGNFSFCILKLLAPA